MKYDTPTTFIATLCLAWTPAVAETIHVPNDFVTIQAAVDAASNGDTIIVSPGTYTYSGSDQWASVVDIDDKQITLRASGAPGETIIDGMGTHRTVSFWNIGTPATVSDGFTITNSPRSGIWCYHASPTITNCIIIANSHDGLGASGGGIDCTNESSPAIINCTVMENSAGDGRGGGIACGMNSSGADTTITGCTISGNYAYWTDTSPSTSGGGGIYCWNGGATITDCIITGNIAANGGGIHDPYLGGSIAITGCTISNNTAATGGNMGGGGIFCYGGDGTLITDCTVTGNTSAAGGGGIWEGSLSGGIDHCTITGNTAASAGGGLYRFHVGFNITISNTSICGNESDQIAGSYYLDEGGNTFADECADACPSDVTGDGVVDSYDILEAIEAWGPCSGCEADTNGDEVVDVVDLLAILTAWGSC